MGHPPPPPPARDPPAPADARLTRPRMEAAPPPGWVGPRYRRGGTACRRGGAEYRRGGRRIPRTAATRRPPPPRRPDPDRAGPDIAARLFWGRVGACRAQADPRPLGREARPGGKQRPLPPPRRPPGATAPRAAARGLKIEARPTRGRASARRAR
eukprot:scaffold6622_cov73-Isochrysis_galbana.AAC.2